MAIEVKHATQAVGTDAGNGEIAKAQWNEAHAINMATGNLLGRSTAGAGAAEEIAIGGGLTLSAGTLAAEVTPGSTTTLSNKTLTDPTITGTLNVNGTNNLLKLKATSGNSILQFDTSATNVASYINFGANGTSDQAYVLFGGSTYAGLGGANSLNVWNTLSAPIVFGVNNAEKMRLDASGNLGIGTSSPAATLHVASAGETTLKISPSSAGSARLYMDGTGGGAAAITSSANGMYLTNTDASPFVFSVNGAERMRLDANGNLGLGVTPSSANLKLLQGSDGFTVGSQGSSFNLVANAAYNSSWLYTSTAAASRYAQSSGQHIWLTAPSGTAGNAISFTLAMTLDNSGNLYTANGKIGPNATQQHTMPAVASDTYTLNAASQTLTNKTLTDPVITGTITEDVFTITDGASVVIDPTNGSIQLWTLGASRTPTSANFGAGESVTLMINDGTAYAVTWTSVPVIWVGGTAPTLATTGYTVIELWKVGTTIYGSRVGQVA